MADKRVRVRFAPSPTGHLHIGGARTALFNWLYARHEGGIFVLRIEDTDTERSTEEYVDAIEDGLRWLGLDWDEGPFRQTERIEKYKKHIFRLIEEGRAYHCYCTPEELDERRKKAIAEGRPASYNRKCLGPDKPITARQPSVRFRMPDAGTIVVDDLIKGKVTFDKEQLDDLIIMRSDGTPTYNFVVVVDDVEMGITHVIRGDDHLNNTPKQIEIYKALGFDVPLFAHLPMILGEDKKRLSKRHGAMSLTAYRDAGFLPDALVNYLVRLGWSHGDQEVFSRKELVEYFAFENVGTSASVFNPEKLLWLNAEYIKAASREELVGLVMPFLKAKGLVKDDDESPDAEWLGRAANTLRERAKTLDEMAESMRYYIAEDVEYDEKAKAKFLKEETLPYLNDLNDALAGLEDFNEEALEKIFTGITEKHSVKLRKLAQPVRVAVTGGTASPGIFEVLTVLGKEKTLRRLERAIAVIKEGV